MLAPIVIHRLIEANTTAVNSHRPVEVTEVVSGMVDALSRRWFNIVGTNDASRAVLAAAIRKSALSEMRSSIVLRTIPCSAEASARQRRPLYEIQTEPLPADVRIARRGRIEAWPSSLGSIHPTLATKLCRGASSDCDLMNDVRVNPQSDSRRGSQWYEIVEPQRAIQEYERLPEMMDDIWLAHKHGWLPVSMIESRRPNRSLVPPWKWLNKKLVYVVAYRHTGQ